MTLSLTFRVTQSQIQQLDSPYDFLLVSNNSHMLPLSVSHSLAAIAPRKTFPIFDHWAKISDLSPHPTPAIHAHPYTGAGVSKSNHSFPVPEGRIPPKWSWWVEHFLRYSVHRDTQKHRNKPLAWFNNNVQELQLYLTPVVSYSVYFLVPWWGLWVK